MDPLGEWANDLDVFSYRFETVVAEWKKSRGKLRDLEVRTRNPRRRHRLTRQLNARAQPTKLELTFRLPSPSSLGCPRTSTAVRAWKDERKLNRKRRERSQVGSVHQPVLPAVAPDR